MKIKIIIVIVVPKKMIAKEIIPIREIFRIRKYLMVKMKKLIIKIQKIL
jgi:hypothetical protein